MADKACWLNALCCYLQQLPSEKDTPETLRAKMGSSSLSSNVKVPLPTRGDKFGKKADDYESNPFGYDQEDTEKFWYVPRLVLLYDVVLYRFE